MIGLHPSKLLPLLVTILFLVPNSIGTYAAEQEELHGARKGVDTSTDVVLVAMPVATLAGVIISQDWEGLKEGALAGATDLAATYILKLSVRERRPDGSDRHSFPSGHSSITFCNATFLMRRYGWKLGVPAYVLSTYTAWGRVYARKHHWWDVVAGAAIGAGSALLYTRPFAQSHDLTLGCQPTPDGMTLSASFTF